VRLEGIRMLEIDLVNFHLSCPLNLTELLPVMGVSYVLNVGPCVMKMMLVINEQKKYIV